MYYFAIPRYLYAKFLFYGFIRKHLDEKILAIMQPLLDSKKIFFLNKEKNGECEKRKKSKKVILEKIFLIGLLFDT